MLEDVSGLKQDCDLSVKQACSAAAGGSNMDFFCIKTIEIKVWLKIWVSTKDSMQILLDVHFLESNKSIREFPKLSVNFI